MSDTVTHADSSNEALADDSRVPPAQRVVRTLLRSRELSILAVLAVVIAAATVKTPSFLFSGNSWRDLLLTPSILLLLAVGQAVVIITRNVDLSVGSVLGFTAYLTGRLFIDHPGLPIITVVLAGLLAGAALGLVNGLLVGFGKVPALVITLGTLYIYRGIVLTWAGSQRINASDMPRGFLDLGTQQILTIPVLFILALVVLVAVGYYLHTARGGREFYAIGSDPDAAVLYGLRVRRRVISAFVLSGALAGLAGVVFAARYGTVSSDAGTGIELQAVAAVVIGGVAIFGGSGTVWGAAIGAVLLVTINRVLPILGIPDFWQQALVGALILSAIVLDRLLAARRARKLIESRNSTQAMTRTYADYAHPWWRRLAFNRETTVIALLVVVIVWAVANVVYFGTQLTMTYLLLDIGADPPDRPADDHRHRHRGDRPVGRKCRRAEQRPRRRSPSGRGVRPCGGPGRSRRGAALRARQRLPRRLCRSALAGRDDRHARALPRARGGSARDDGRHRLPQAAGPTWPRRRSGRPAIPVITIPFVLLAVSFGLLLQYSPFGRGIYDIGLNSEAAQFSGVNVRRTKFILFLFTGVVSAFAGVYYTLRFGSARGDNATGLELQVVAAVLLGGVSIFGGRGRLPGVIAGVLLIGAISSALRLQGVTVNVISIIIGLLLSGLGGVDKCPGVGLRRRCQA